MRIAVLQPGYLPWLGFFEQMARVDRFVIYDDVQYDRGGWRNRNRVKTARGVRWLTVPVHAPYRDAARVMDVRIDNRTDWRRKHLLTLLQSYARAPHLARYAGLLEETYARTWESLVELDLHLVGSLAALLGIDPGKMVRASTLGVAGEREERLLGICARLGADAFYEGAAGRGYLDAGRFAAAGVRLEYQEYRHPVYPQLHGDFVSHLSVVDLLFNCGDDSRAFLLGEKGEVIPA